MSDEQRSSETRARAERALVRLLHELGDEPPFLVVHGGLVPEVLTRTTDAVIPDHLGTTDVDALLITHVNPDADLGAVEGALERMRFEPDPGVDGWRWSGPIDGWPTQIEFLCDLGDQREGESIRPAGCRRLAAANLRGTGYVAQDFAWEELTGALADGTEVRVLVRFAGLEGYLLSKCVAARTRAATKDYYDLAYVLLHNRAGGPDEAAARLLSGDLADALRRFAPRSSSPRTLRADLGHGPGRVRRAGATSRPCSRPGGAPSRRCRRGPAIHPRARHLIEAV